MIGWATFHRGCHSMCRPPRYLDHTTYKPEQDQVGASGPWSSGVVQEVVHWCVSARPEEFWQRLENWMVW